MGLGRNIWLRKTSQGGQHPDSPQHHWQDHWTGWICQPIALPRNNQLPRSINHANGNLPSGRPSHGQTSSSPNFHPQFHLPQHKGLEQPSSESNWRTHIDCILLFTSSGWIHLSWKRGVTKKTIQIVWFEFFAKGHQIHLENLLKIAENVDLVSMTIDNQKMATEAKPSHTLLWKTKILVAQSMPSLHTYD